MAASSPHGFCRGWAPAQLQGNFWQGWLIFKLLLGKTMKKYRSLFCPCSAELSVLGLQKYSSAALLGFLFSFRAHIFFLSLHQVSLQFNTSFKTPSAAFNGFPRSSFLSFILLFSLLIISLVFSRVSPPQKSLPCCSCLSPVPHLGANCFQDQLSIGEIISLCSAPNLSL